MKTVLIISLVVTLAGCGLIKGSPSRDAGGLAGTPPALLCACGAAPDHVA